MIKWNEGLNLGVKILDDDHKELLRIIGKLSEAIDNNVNREILEKIFQDLQNSVQNHLHNEEVYLQNCNCTKLDNHVKKHRFFLNQLSELKKKVLSSQDYISSQDITVYLAEWLLNHIIEEDIPAIALFQQCGPIKEESKENSSLLAKLVKTTMDRFSFTKRIFLSAVVPLSGMLLFGTIVIFVNFNEYLDMKKASNITYIALNTNELVHNFQIERGLSSVYLISTEDKFKKNLEKRRIIVDEAIKKFIDKIKTININDIKTIESNIITLKKDILSFNNIRKKIDSKTVSQIYGISIYSKIIENMLNLTSKIAFLNLDRELSSSISTLSSIQHLKESLGQERAYGTVIIEKKDATLEEYISFAKILGAQMTYLDIFGHTASEAQKKIIDSFLNSDIAKQIHIYKDGIKSHNYGNLDSLAWFRLTTQFINEIKLFEDELLHEINISIDNNIASSTRNFLFWIFFNTIILAITFLLLYTFKRSTVTQIDQLTNAMKDLATGGRGFKLSPINMSRDEMAYMYDAYEITRQKLLKGDLYTQLYLSRKDIELKNKERENFKLEEMAFVDPLTGAVNRRKFEELSNEEFKRSKRYKSNLSFLMLDLDHFKAVNDTYGHAAGDEILKHFSSICLDMARNMDIVARIGGEEFVVVLPETNSQGAYVFAERIRKKIFNSVVVVENTPIKYSVSIGIAVLDFTTDADVKSIIQRADKALYEAKRSGRNTTIIFE